MNFGAAMGQLGRVGFHSSSQTRETSMGPTQIQTAT